MRSSLRSRWQLLAAALLLPCLLVPFAIFALLSTAIFERGLLSQYSSRAEVVAQTTQSRLEHGIDLFGSLSDLRGIDGALTAALASSGEVAFIAISAPDGRPIAQQPADFPVENVLAEMRLDEGVSDRAISPIEWMNSAYRSLTGQSLIAALPANAREVDGFLITTVPIRSDGGTVGRIHLGLEIADFEGVREEIIYDTISVFIATLLVGAECFILLFVTNILSPMRIRGFLVKRLAAMDLREVVEAQRYGWSNELVRIMNAFVFGAVDRAYALGGVKTLRLPKGPRPRVTAHVSASDIRLPLFLFSLGEGILRPSMPGYLAGVGDSVGMGGEVQAAIAISFFFLATLVGIIASRAVIARIGQREVFQLGALLSAAGILAHVFAANGVDSVLARALSGLGYGFVFGAAQSFVASYTPKARRAHGLSLFVIVVVSAEIAGPAVGGVLADQLGVHRTMAFAAMVVAISTFASHLVLPSRIEGIEPLPVKLFQGGLVLTDFRLLVMMLCFTMPARALLTGGMFVLAPLAAAELGASITEAGRILMCSALAVYAASIFITMMLKHQKYYGSTFFVGTAVAGLAFAIPVFVTSVFGLFAAVIVFGLGHAITILAQPGFLERTQRRRVEETGMEQVKAQLQAWERVAAALGPMLAAILLVLCSALDALFLMGVGAFLAMGLGAAYFLTVGDRDEDEAIDALLVRR